MNNLLSLKELAQEFSVLYVEDEAPLRKNVKKYLKKIFLSVDTAKDGQEGLELYKKKKFDLVMTDINMPKSDGLEMASKIKEINENQNILIVSAYSDVLNFTTSIKLGIDGYILKPIDYKQLNSVLFKILVKIKQANENEEYKENLEKLVEEKTKQTKQLQDEKVKNYEKTLFALAKMIEDRDQYTGGHSQRVAKYSKMMAKEFGFDDEACENIYRSGMLHDIGKIIIPDSILLKPGALSYVEYTIIKEHVSIGVDILKKVPMFVNLALIIDAHHERYDGSGYPNGLKGDEILLESQIMATCDAFDAMTTSRIYKARKSVEDAIKEIQSLKDIHFSGAVVEVASKVLSKVVIDEDINQLPVSQIEKERFSYFYRDQITQTYNLNYLDLILIKNSYKIKYKYIYLIAIHNLNSFNIKYGWKEGDKYLKNVSDNLQSLYKNVLFFRIYGDDFLILSETKIDIDKNKLKDFIIKGDIVFDVKKYNIVKNNISSLHDFEVL